MWKRPPERKKKSVRPLTVFRKRKVEKGVCPVCGKRFPVDEKRRGRTKIYCSMECRSDIPHSSDEWSNVLNVAEEYERYVEDKRITNGNISQDTQYLRKLYQELSMEHKF